ncbi:uncharacterized protein LOC131671831 [Phymastichus coffea]|uniref:uncharacterized protein LOC131671831 n=1 Tax=Phymastichus coffea TaxID=108790 RepID=UPI00273CB818|nr:uncharacterized protein LOC131671831 [Phymastichus coffea]
MTSVGILTLTVLTLAVALKAEDTSTTTTPTTLLATTTNTTNGGDKISRRIIEDRLMPPRASDFATWNKRFPVGDVYRGNTGAPKVTEELDDNVTEKALPLKRTVGSSSAETKASGCCGIGGKSSAPNGFTDEKVKSESSDLTSGSGPTARFHGNKQANDDRYSYGWKSSSYLGYQSDKDKGYYNQRNRYPYDRYSSGPRPTSQGYGSQDGDRYTSPQRPSTVYALDGDRYGPGRPSGNYQSANYAYGGPYGAARPGITGNIGEGDTDYPFPEGGPPTGLPPSNLQTQKAVALKALAGVALIGAAAALATNPVLMPISVISGRRKRSAELKADNYALTALLQGYIQPTPNEVEQREQSEGGSNTTATTTSHQELVISPQCVARLACHVHRDYLDELEKSKAVTDEAALHGLEHWFDSLIHSNILVADYLSDELKELIESAITIGSDKNASCNQFSCLTVRDSSVKSTTVDTKRTK